MTRDMIARRVSLEHTCATMYVPTGVNPARWWLRCDCGDFTISGDRDGFVALSEQHREHVRDMIRAAGVTGW